MHLIAIVDFLKQTDELKTAKELLKTFAKFATSVEQYDELGMLFEKIKAYPESLEMLEKCHAVATTPNQLYSVRSNFAKVYNHLNEPLKSIYYSNLNLEVNPFDVELKLEQSFSYYLYADFQKSWEIQNKLLKDPSISENVKNRITFNMGSYDIEQGLFKQGMEKMILGGKRIGLWPAAKKPFEKWQGENTDKTLLIYAEAGIGDQIIHIRFMNELKKRNINAIWIDNYAKNPICDVFKFSGYNLLADDTLLDTNKEYVYTDSTSLSVMLSLDMHELWHEPYLKVNEEYIEKWKKILPKKFVTIRWNGNPAYDQDLHRGVPFELLFNTVRNNISDDVAIVSLQIDENQKEYEGLINVDIKDWFDTMAIQKLALTNVTSCTSTAHSAGAIGANCMVLPPICTYYPWVYLKENKNSYWYGSNLKAFVQTKWKNWNEPMNLLTIELGAMDG